MGYLKTPIPVKQGGTGLSTTTANNLLYSSSGDVIAQLGTANEGVLTTGATGIPIIDTTNFHVLSTGVQVKANNAGTAPPAGFIGEEIRAFLAEGSSVSLAASGSFYTVRSIILDAGTWDISALCKITQATSGTVAKCQAGIATTTNSNTGWVQGDNAYDGPPPLFNIYGVGFSIANFRQVISSTTTYYLTASANFSSGTYAASGRISAIRR